MNPEIKIIIIEPNFQEQLFLDGILRKAFFLKDPQVLTSISEYCNSINEPPDLLVLGSSISESDRIFLLQSLLKKKQRIPVFAVISLKNTLPELSRSDHLYLLEYVIKEDLSSFCLNQSFNRLRFIHQLELKNSQISKEFDFFSYIVSHDLQAPLRAIRHLSEWIEEDLQENISSEIKKNLTLLRSRTNRLSAMIEGLLQYFRATKINSEKTSVSIEKLLQDIFKRMENPFSLILEIHSGMPVLQTEESAIRQVFWHLIQNAIQFHPQKGGQVSVSCTETEADYEFAVSDNGPGIAPEHHQKIFEVFHTLAPRDKIETVGIGLAIVKKIVEFYGGNVRVKSALNTGSTFFFTWPKKGLNE